MAKSKQLSREAQTIRQRLIKEYAICDAGGLNILDVGLEAYDRMRSASKQIKADGECIRDRWNQIKPHPLLPVERDSRAQWLQALKQLNLDLEPLRDRPGRPGGS